MTASVPAGRLLPLLLLCLGVAACGAPRYSTNFDDYQDEVQRLQRHLATHPDDAEAAADLGIIYVRTRQYNEGVRHLARAHGLVPDRPDVAYYLGAAREALGQQQEALALYAHYADVPPGSPYRRLLEGRHQLLARALARAEIQALLATEADRSPAGADAHVLAVMPLQFQGGDPRYAPLARGLSEMLTVDLANVNALRLVERLRLQALLDELQLAQTGAVEAATAPRVGRLLGAGRIVSGGLSIDGDRALRITPDVVSLAPGETLTLPSTTGRLDDLFDLEKEMVFGLIDELGIRLSPEEQARIEYVPTRNIQAFLAYSQGLEAQDVGNYEAAAGFFEQALQLDPGFSAAGQAAGAAGSLGDASAAPTPEGAVDAPSKPPRRGPVRDVVHNRQRSLNATIGSHFHPRDQESRKAAPEASEATNNTTPGSNPLSPRLPDPPPPPQGGN